MFRPSGLSDAQAVSLVGLRPPPRFRWVGQHPTFLLRLHDTTTGWWAECLGVGFVVGRRLIEGGAVPCLSPVVTDFPEISRKFEGLRLELVSRNFALVQQKDVSGPTHVRDCCRWMSRVARH